MLSSPENDRLIMFPPKKNAQNDSISSKADELSLPQPNAETMIPLGEDHQHNYVPPIVEGLSSQQSNCENGIPSQGASRSGSTSLEATVSSPQAVGEAIVSPDDIDQSHVPPTVGESSSPQSNKEIKIPSNANAQNDRISPKPEESSPNQTNDETVISPEEKSQTDNVSPKAEGSTPAGKPHKALLRGLITLSAAEEEEDDMTARLQYAAMRGKFYAELKMKENDIKSVVASHCRLASLSSIHIADMVDEKDNSLLWIHGSFNVCIPVYIHQPGLSLPSRMAFRVPLPFKVGEDSHPGNCEEKLRSKAATYIWMSKNCPEIPIPTLRGFGVPGGLSFFQSRSITPWQRIKFLIRRLFSRIRGRTGFCDYIPRTRTAFMDHGYTLVDWIENEDEQMLSNVFRLDHTEAQTQNLYRSLAKIMVSVAKIPQPRIGSWTIDNDGQLTLSNRPLLCHLQRLEGWNIPSGIARGTTYTSADSFNLDLLAGHDNRLRYQKNAAFDENDARHQAVDLVLMRANLARFTDRSLREGPFVMHLTDIHSSNIFVDKDWNVTHLIDLEWACSLPLEHVMVPYWLTGKGIDQLIGPEYERFENCYRQFTEAIRKEETTTASLCQKGTTYSLATTMDHAWQQHNFWFLSALYTPKGLFNVFRCQLQPLFDKPPEGTSTPAVSVYWAPGMSSFVESKLKDLANYIQEVREIFNSSKSGSVIIQ